MDIRSRVGINILLLGLIVSGTGIPSIVASQADYRVAIEDSIVVPDYEVTFGGDQHTISAIGRGSPGEQLEVRVSTPNTGSYEVLLYNGDRQIITSKEGSGDQTIAFDLTGYEPGSYLIALYKDGDYKAIQPLVVRGYRVTVDAPARATPSTEITVSVTIEQVYDVEPAQSVRVALTSGTETRQVTAVKQSDGSYTATISLDGFTTGEARVYAVVQGPDTAFKESRNELFGVSPVTALAIEEQTTQSPTETPTRTESTTTTPTQTTTEPSGTTTATTQSTPSTTRTTDAALTTPTQTDRTATSSTTHTATGTSATTSTTHTEATTTAVTTTNQTPEQQLATTQGAHGSTAPTTATTAGEVIMPAQSTSQPTTTPPSTVPGFGFESGLLAIVGLLVLVYRR